MIENGYHQYKWVSGGKFFKKIIFPSALIDVCIEQTSICMVSGSHCSTAYSDGTHTKI